MASKVTNGQVFRHPALWQNGQIGNLILKNRIIMAAMGNALADDKANVTEALLEYYRVRAKGGAAMVITQLASVSSEDVMPYNLGIYNDSFITGLSRLVKVNHDQGARACIQLMHPGMLLLLLKSLSQGMTIKVPNVTPAMPGDRSFQVLTISDIEKYILDFVAAAVRAKEAGADAIELHACHGCLLSTFLTPAVNRRTDLYGGNVENRTRFVSEIVRQIKDRLGSEFPLIVRINGNDDIDNGVTPEEVVEQSRIISAAGADAISISSGLEYWSTLMAPSYLTREGIVIPVAEKVRKAISKPVLVSGKITPRLAEQTISGGQSDFVVLGRPILADPEVPNKLREGKDEDIVHCLYCNNCLRTSWRSCTVNPTLFRELTTHLIQINAVKKMMVIGGGLAGMEAAVLCKRRGYEVVLFEKGRDLGGQWRIASALPGKEKYASIIDYLKNTLDKLKVPIHLNTEITVEKVRDFKPDIAVIATGAIPSGIEVPGAGGSNVYQANDVIQERVNTGDTINVIGGSMLAMEIAIFLAEKGKKVILVSHSGLGGRKGPDDMITFRGLMRRLVELRIPLYLDVEVVEFSQKAVVVRMAGENVSLACDSIVLAAGVQPVDNLIRELKGIVPEIYPIGDCVMPGNAAQATYSALRMALRL